MSKLERDHDAGPSRHAERLNASAGAVIAAVRDLEAVPSEDQWAKKAAGKVAGQVAQHVAAGGGRPSHGARAPKSVDGIANVLAWTLRALRSVLTRASRRQ